jgi:hypothetical protein
MGIVPHIDRMSSVMVFLDSSMDRIERVLVVVVVTDEYISWFPLLLDA